MRIRIHPRWALLLVPALLAGCAAGGAQPTTPATTTGEATPAQTATPPVTAAPATATVPTAAPTATPAAGLPLPTLPGFPTPGGTMPIHTTQPDNYEPNLEPYVQTALKDLAQRLSLTAAEIQVLEARAVIWPDASIGCPQPGMAYAQVLVEGVQVRLQAGGREYDYHGGGRRELFLCEPAGGTKPAPPANLEPRLTPPGE